MVSQPAEESHEREFDTPETADVQECLCEEVLQPAVEICDVGLCWCLPTKGDRVTLIDGLKGVPNGPDDRGDE